jgi:hypothetical protein
VACGSELEVEEAPELAADSESESELELEGVADLEAADVVIDRDGVTEALSADTVAAAEALGSESPPSVMMTGNMPKYSAGSTVENERAASTPSGHSSEAFSGSAHIELISASRPLVVMVQVASWSSVFWREHAPEIVTVMPESEAAASYP